MVQIKISNKIIYSLILLVVLLGFIGFVFAQPDISFGHLARDVYVYISEEWFSLQDAIDEGLIGGGSEPSGFGEGLSGWAIKEITQSGHGNTFCVIRNDDRVSCSGYNSQGQIGIGDTIRRITFKENPSLENVKKLSAGMLHFCALYEEAGKGKIKCWGYNGYGQLGVGDNKNRLNPTKVIGLESENIIDVQIRKAFTGDYYTENTCALAQSGKIYCWGYNHDTHGTLGNGENGHKYTPTQVSDINNAVKFVLGGHSTGGYGCALLSDGTVKCWGYNGYGQLGDGTKTSRKTPIQVSTLNSLSVIDIIATPSDYGTTCALIDDGTIRCWGRNNDGQVGSGNKGDSEILTPTPVINIDGINSKATKIVSSGAGTRTSFCALLEDKTVKCWGDNRDGRIGLSSSATSNVCLDGKCGCRASSTSVNCYAEPVSVPGLSNIKDVQLTAWGDTGYGCALLSDGTVKCWGYNGYGQLGVGDTITRFQPTDIQLSGYSVNKLFLTMDIGKTRGQAHSTAIVLSDNTPRVWGYNANGGLGTGDTNHYRVPVSPL